MDDGVFFTLIMGFLMGMAVTLVIQAYGRRKVRAALNQDTNVDPVRSVALLANENEHQGQMIVRLEERLAVLERINTDPAERTARAIEALRG
jgi:hypothetical protein